MRLKNGKYTDRAIGQNSVLSQKRTERRPLSAFCLLLCGLLFFSAGCSKPAEPVVNFTAVTGKEIQGLSADYTIQIDQVTFSDKDPNGTYDPSILEKGECFMTLELTVTNKADKPIEAENVYNFKICIFEDGDYRKETGKPLRQDGTKEILPDETVTLTLFWIVPDKGPLELDYDPLGRGMSVDYYIIRGTDQ